MTLTVLLAASALALDITDALRARSTAIQVYYWPFLGRGASLVCVHTTHPTSVHACTHTHTPRPLTLSNGLDHRRMLEHTGTPYEYVSDKAKMAEYASAWGSTAGDTFAPPILVDGDVVVSQSIATCLYLGKKLGLEPPGYDVYKAMQARGAPLSVLTFAGS